MVAVLIKSTKRAEADGMIEKDGWKRKIIHFDGRQKREIMFAKRDQLTGRESKSESSSSTWDTVRDQLIP
jgi:hypothetical protein